MNGTGMKRVHPMKHWKTIMRMALPSLISFATMTATGTISLILVGSMGKLIIAIVGVSNITMYNTWALFSGIGHTVNYLVAQSYGAEDVRKAVQRTGLALYISIGVGLIIAGVGCFASEGLMHLISGSDEMTREGTTYLQIRFFAMVFSVFNFVFFGFFRGIGDTLTPMVLSLVSNLTAIFLTFTLTYGKWGFPNWGLSGAGWAVWIGEALCLAGCVYMYFFRLHRQFSTRSKIGADWPELKLISIESGKLGIQELSLSLSMFIFTMFVARLGTTALASNEVALNVMSFGFMPAYAFGATATILVGQEVGRRQPMLAKRMGTDTAVLGSLLLFVLGCMEFVFADPITRLFTADPEVYLLTTSLIRTSAFLQLFDGLLNFYSGGLRGIGDTSFLLKSSLALSWLLFVPLAYALTFLLDWKSIGAWLALYSFLTCFGITVMIRYYRTDWHKVSVKAVE